MRDIHHTPTAPKRLRQLGDIGLRCQPTNASHIGKAIKPRRAAGFTLVELLIAVVVMGVLVAVALPSYQESIRKSRRAEAVSALTVVQQAQERFRANSPKYGKLSDLPLLTPKHYKLSVTDNAESEYVVVATAVDGQAADTACAVMGVRAKGGNLLYGSGKTSIDWTLSEPDTGQCFAK